MVGTDWLFTVAQASATFVAIVSAFFTTKILSISSEKRTLQNRVSVINSELDSRKKLLSEHRSEIDSIRTKWAEERVTDFVKGYLSLMDEKLSNVPQIDELFAVFAEWRGRQANEYEKHILHSRYPSLKSEIEERIAKRKEMSTLSKILTSFPVLSLPVASSLASTRAEADRLAKLDDEYEGQFNTIAILEGTKARYEEQIEALAFPRFAKFGLGSLVYFGVVGVVVPLYCGLSLSVVDYASGAWIMAAFVSGLSLTFVYLGLEMREALRK
jgi:hypothetical protein